MIALLTARALWMPDGARPACAGMPPEWWFPPPGPSPAIERAKAVCHLCPLMEPCAEYAIPLSDLSGVWGSLTATERAAERRRRQVAAGISVCGCAHHRTSHRAVYGSSRRMECDQCDCPQYQEG